MQQERDIMSYNIHILFALTDDELDDVEDVLERSVRFRRCFPRTRKRCCRSQPSITYRRLNIFALENTTALAESSTSTSSPLLSPPPPVFFPLLVTMFGVVRSTRIAASRSGSYAGIPRSMIARNMNTKVNGKYSISASKAPS